jgi:oligopeptide transport system permease protein
MARYIVKRLAFGLCAIFILATVTFFLMKIIPGNPFHRENKTLSAEQMEKLNAQFGLDKPLFEQYLTYLSKAAKGEFGDSIKRIGTPIVDVIARSAPVTARLGIVAFCIALTVGILFGIVSALTKSRLVNSTVTVFATLGVSIPSFLLAMMLMIVFGVKLGWVKLVGLDTPLHYVLPACALALYPISMITRLTRSSLIDVMNKDYITLARSKGTPEVLVIIKHGLKNALLPVVTYCGPMLVGLLTGSFVIETLFTIPGIGSEFVKSVTNRDYTLIMGLTIFLGSLMILMNLLSDIAAALIDPRIKFDK